MVERGVFLEGDAMKKLIGLSAIVLLLDFKPIPTSLSQPESSQDASRSTAASVKGDLLGIDGDEFLLKDPSGKEVRLHVSKDAEVYSSLKSGDQIEAWLEPDGTVKTIMIVRCAP
jgi:hypothetical protein